MQFLVLVEMAWCRGYAWVASYRCASMWLCLYQCWNRRWTIRHSAKKKKKTLLLLYRMNEKECYKNELRDRHHTHNFKFYGTVIFLYFFPAHKLLPNWIEWNGTCINRATCSTLTFWDWLLKWRMSHAQPISTITHSIINTFHAKPWHPPTNIQLIRIKTQANF